MHRLISVIATNQVNRKNSVFTDGALEDGAKQINEQGGIPQLHSHDWTRLLGWVTHAWTERKGNLLQLLCETHFPETVKEYEEISCKFQTYCERMHEERTHSFMEYLHREEYTQDELTFDVSCVYITGKGILLRTFPTLSKKIDNDGLFLLGQFTSIGDGFIENGKYLLVPHMCFRQGYSLPNMLNRDFFGALVRTHRSHPELKIKLRLDHKLVGIRESLGCGEQLDYWWGPKYEGYPYETDYGVCVHVPTKYDRAFGLLRQTEFWWYGKETRTLEIEEILEQPIWCSAEKERKIGMRFVHSLFDPKTQRPCHLDGSIRLYDEELFEARKHRTIDKFGKSAERLKLWRIDGDISIEIWFTLIHTFFRNNFMVAEYFGVGYENSE
jgi:hypothetical protein